MSNDSKYVRLYPERAVLPIRRFLEALLVTAKSSGDAVVEASAVERALDDLDSLGFPDNEPLFLLRGQDILAPEAVRRYVEEVERSGAFGGVDRNGEAMQDIIDHADDMERWQPRKLPD